MQALVGAAPTEDPSGRPVADVGVVEQPAPRLLEQRRRLGNRRSIAFPPRHAHGSHRDGDGVGAWPVDSPGTRTPTRSTGSVGGSPSSCRSSAWTPSWPSLLAGVETTVSGGLHADRYSSEV